MSPVWFCWDEDGSVYGTRWDDEPLETEKFVNREPLSEILVRFGEKNSDAATDETDTERTFADAEPESVITQGTERGRESGESAAWMRIR